MTNHGCRFTWCVNEMSSHKSQRLEHFADVERVPATGSSLAGISRGQDTQFTEIGVSARFNEDIEAAPTVSVNISGGHPHVDVEADLRPDEAILLYNALGAAIQQAIEGTNLDPARVTAFYSQEAR